MKIIAQIIKYNRSRAAASIAVCALSILFGCDDGGDLHLNRDRFERMKAGAVDTYIFLHPLRSSRFGITAADSALFTFSDEEIETAVSRIKGLLDLASDVTSEGLSHEEILTFQITVDWLRGEKFAFEELKLYKINPMLFCWIANEALWGIPMKTEPPVPTEEGLYKERLKKLPSLLDNAKRQIEKPSQLHLSMSLDMLDVILAGREPLNAALGERYKSETDYLEPVFKALKDYVEFIRNDLWRRARGRVILGSENVAKIFEYEEHITENPNTLMFEAERRIRGLIVSRNAILRKLGGGGTDEKPAGSLDKDTLDKIKRVAFDIMAKAGEGGTGQGGRSEVPDIRELPIQGRFDYYRKNPYLSIPYRPAPLLEWVPPVSLKEGKKTGFIAVYGTGRGIREEAHRNDLMIMDPDGSSVEYDLISSLSASRSCSGSLLKSDTLRTLLCSETYHYGCVTEDVAEKLRSYGGEVMKVRLHAVENEILDLALMIAVFRLHGGNYSIDSATSFFVDTAGLRKDQAAIRVREALVSPSAAYPGLARVLSEAMSEKLRKSEDVELRRKRLIDILDSNPSLPLPMIDGLYF